jgi:hypothetical protein
LNLTVKSFKQLEELAALCGERRWLGVVARQSGDIIQIEPLCVLSR